MEFGFPVLSAGLWLSIVMILVLLSWLIFYYSPVVIKTTISFVVFSVILLTVSLWVGTHSIIEFVREWSEYEVSRIEEGAFTFIERRKSDQRTIVKRFTDEPEKILEDRFAKTVLDYIAIADRSGKIIASNKNLNFNISNIEGDLEQGFYKSNGVVYLLTVANAKDDKFILIGEQVEIRIIPALQGMLSIKEAYIQTGQEDNQQNEDETVLKNAQIELGSDINLVLVPNYDLVFELVSKLATETSRGIGVSLILAAVFFAILSLIYIRKPLMGLISASSEVEKGNFEYEIPDRPKGDIGKLINTFNSMIKGLRKRDAQIKYRNELLSAIRELARAILNEFDKEKVFEICVDTAGIKTGSKCAIFYSDKIRYSEKPDIEKQDLEGLQDGETIKKDGNYILYYEISAHKEEGKILYGKFVAQRDRDFSQEEKEFFSSIVNYAASACLRIDYVMKLKLLQSTDSVTGLFNSTFFKSSVKREVSMFQRFQRHFAIVFIDIQNSSEIIDRFGNIIWEDIIKAVSMIMKKSVRTYDIPARLGNDRFALLLPNTVAQNAKVVEDRVRDIIRSAPEIPSLPELEIKIEVSSIATDSTNVDEIFRSIDQRISAVQEK